MSAARGEGPGAASRAGSAGAAWRRTVHLASGVIGPLAARLPAATAALAFGGLVALAGAAETLRLASPKVHAWIERLAGRLFRPAEAAGVSGATALALGYALAWWLFPGRAAERAILVTAVADPTAAVVGGRFGAGAGKSWAGSAACAAAAAVVLVAAGTPPAAVAAAAVGAALAERAPWRGADNVTVPIVVAALLRLLA